MKSFALFIALLLILLITGALVLDYVAKSERQNSTVCTMDVQECPDGSYVGRVPPECEFALCP